MAISTGMALLGSGLLGAGASIASGNAAAGAATAGANASNQTQRYMFDVARADAAPFRSAGANALSSLMSFLGLPAASPTSAGSPATAPGGGGNALTYGMRGGGPGSTFADLLGSRPMPERDGAGAMLDTSSGEVVPAAAGPSGFDQFLNSTGYTFLRDEGENALSRLLARNGQLGSGRAMREAINLNQRTAQSNAIAPWLQQLNAIAGFGQNAALTGGNQAIATGANIGAGQVAAGNARAGAYTNTGNALNNAMNQYWQWRGASGPTNYSYAGGGG
jgi:hypothetical protein